MSVLEADGIQFSYGQRKLLSDIYIKCKTGSITGLLGRNGQGKSTLMQIIFGTLKAESSIRINQIAHVPFRYPVRIAYLPQHNFIPGSLSLSRIFEDYETDFQLFEKRFPEFQSKQSVSINKFSGGNRRFIEIYVLLQSTSSFLLMDEPFTHIDPNNIDVIKELMIEAKSTKGLLVTDHMYKNVVDVNDTLYVLKDGKTHLIKDLNEIETYGYVRR